MGEMDAEAMDVYPVQWWSKDLHWTAVCANGDELHHCEILPTI